MKLTYFFAFLSAALITISAHALEVTTKQHSPQDTRTGTNSALYSKMNTKILVELTEKITHIETCQANNALYNPNSPDADSDGCVEVKAGLKKIAWIEFKASQYHRYASTLCGIKASDVISKSDNVKLLPPNGGSFNFPAGIEITGDLPDEAVFFGSNTFATLATSSENHKDYSTTSRAVNVGMVRDGNKAYFCGSGATAAGNNFSHSSYSSFTIPSTGIAPISSKGSIHRIYVYAP